MILAVDPGTTHSAFVLYDPSKSELRAFNKRENAEIINLLGAQHDDMRTKMGDPNPLLVVEMIASYGMAVGREVFDTCVWIGRFIQAWPGRHQTMYRQTAKLHLCQSPRAKDANVRQALLDRWGGKAKAVGTKREPGALYGVSGDVWAALAVAVTCGDAIADPLSTGLTAAPIQEAS